MNSTHPTSGCERVCPETLLYMCPAHPPGRDHLRLPPAGLCWVRLIVCGAGCIYKIAVVPLHSIPCSGLIWLGIAAPWSQSGAVGTCGNARASRGRCRHAARLLAGTAPSDICCARPCRLHLRAVSAAIVTPPGRLQKKKLKRDIFFRKAVCTAFSRITRRPFDTSAGDTFLQRQRQRFDFFCRRCARHFLV